MLKPGTRVKYLDGRVATVADYKNDKDFLLKHGRVDIDDIGVLILFDEPIEESLAFYPYYIVGEFCLTVIKEENVSLSNGEDVCKKCGTAGKINGMACICSGCGNIIWGC